MSGLVEFATTSGLLRPVHRMGQDARRRNIHLLAYNTRFLILPWVKVAHLASHSLGPMAKRVSTEWQQSYAHPVYLLETFVDTEQFRGTCYRAANWVSLGHTAGRGKNDLTHQPNRSINLKKAVGLLTVIPNR